MIRKSYSKTGRACRVTFRLPAETKATKAAVLGDFNDWQPGAHPLVRRKDGSLSATLNLASGRTYRFRYLLNGESWANEPDADGYAPNRFGTDDSLLEV
jgi:1,4-alpha-glucan branching enzyme